MENTFYEYIEHAAKMLYPFCAFETWIVKLTATKSTEFVAMAGRQ